MTTRSWARGQVKEPYYPEGHAREAVKFLRVMAFRFLKGNANAQEVIDACNATVVELQRQKGL